MFVVMDIKIELLGTFLNCFVANKAKTVKIRIDLAFIKVIL